MTSHPIHHSFTTFYAASTRSRLGDKRRDTAPGPTLRNWLPYILYTQLYSSDYSDWFSWYAVLHRLFFISSLIIIVIHCRWWSWCWLVLIRAPPVDTEPIVQYSGWLAGLSEWMCGDNTLIKCTRRQDWLLGANEWMNRSELSYKMKNTDETKLVMQLMWVWFIWWPKSKAAPHSQSLTVSHRSSIIIVQQRYIVFSWGGGLQFGASPHNNTVVKMLRFYLLGYLNQIHFFPS